MTSKRVAMILGALSVAAIAVAAYFQISAPMERTMGIVQKTVYVHVPSAWNTYLAFFVNFICSIIFLIRGKRSVDRVAVASAEVGLVFCTLVLLSGPIWARPIWGHWWIWEPRLTMTLVIWFVYVGYMVLRSMAPTPEAGARYAAVLAIVGILLLPVVHFAVDWWGGIHPPSPEMVPEMKLALRVSGLAGMVVCAFFITMRTAVEVAKDAAAETEHKRVASTEELAMAGGEA